MESLVGSLGLERILSPKPITITKADVTKALRFDKSIRPRLQKFLASDTPIKYKVPESQVTLKNYESLKKLLDEPRSEDEIIRKVQNLTSTEAAVFLGSYGNVLQTLQAATPTAVVDGIFGTEDEEPSHEDKAEFIWLCQQANDISWIFTLLESGALSESDSLLYETLYPDTYKVIVLELAALLIEKSTDKVSKIGRGWKKIAIAALLKSPVVTPESLALLHQQDEQQDQTSNIQIEQQGLTPALQLEE